MRKKETLRPRTMGECEVGHVVETDEGVFKVVMLLAEQRWVRRVDPETLAEVSDTFCSHDLPIRRVVRDQSYFRMHPRAGGRESDPLKGG